MNHIPLLRRILFARNHFRSHADSHTFLPLSPEQLFQTTNQVGTGSLVGSAGITIS
jgi:hypothetical protein